MFNPFVMRKWVALLLPQLVTTILFFVGLVYYGLYGGIGFMAVGLLLGILLGSLFLRNPFSAMLEGKGLMTIGIDSTGILKPFIISIQTPLVKGFLGRKKVETIFDRDMVHQLSAPIVLNASQASCVVAEDGTKKFTISKELWNSGRFALNQYPVLLYNEQLGCFITKDFLAGQEKDIFAEHNILHLLRKVEDLSGWVRDFARHIVDSLKPKEVGSLFGNKWFLIIAGILLLLLAIWLVPKLFSGGTGLLSTALPGAVTPRG